MELGDMKIVDQALQLCLPRLLAPELGVALEIALPASYLIVGDDLAVGQLRQWVEHLEIVVGRARSAMKQNQRSLVRLLSYDAIKSLIAFERHESCRYLHMHITFMK